MTAQILLNFSRTFSTKTPRKRRSRKNEPAEGKCIVFLFQRQDPMFAFSLRSHSAFPPRLRFPPRWSLYWEQQRESSNRSSHLSRSRHQCGFGNAFTSLRFNLVIVTHPSTAAAILRREKPGYGSPERRGWRSFHRQFSLRQFCIEYGLVVKRKCFKRNK